MGCSLLSSRFPLTKRSAALHLSTRSQNLRLGRSYGGSWSSIRFRLLLPNYDSTILRQELSVSVNCESSWSCNNCRVNRILTRMCVFNLSWFSFGHSLFCTSNLRCLFLKYHFKIMLCNIWNLSQFLWSVCFVENIQWTKTSYPRFEYNTWTRW